MQGARHGPLSQDTCAEGRRSTDWATQAHPAVSFCIPFFALLVWKLHILFLSLQWLVQSDRARLKSDVNQRLHLPYRTDTQHK